jgi:hypothetical protein
VLDYDSAVLPDLPRRPCRLPWYRETIWADAVAMSAPMLVVLVSDKPAIMALFIVPLIVVIPGVFLVALMLRAASAVPRMLRAATRRRRYAFPVKL